jgi:glucosamine--fructose-6-phosphate aminotransferase (isomerizing)
LAGIAVSGGKNGLEILRAKGELRNLEEVIQHNHIDGTYGIGHSRWATHGRPSSENAHLHRDCSGAIVVVHNGIVENHLALKKQLRQEFFILEDPDKKISLEKAVRMTVRRLSGVFALSVSCSSAPGKIVAARHGPPP